MQNIKELLSFWHYEIVGEDKKFSFFRLYSRMRNKPGLKFVFWWRLASYLYFHGYKRIAYNIHSRLKKNFSCDIMLGASIGPGLTIAHHVGIVVTKRVVIGKNLKLTQNCVIGSVGKNDAGKIVIGDNFFMGSNSCVIADSLHIGSNVSLGAMSFVNKDLPDNCTVYTKKENIIIERLTPED
ncbi:serine acetyltransferase [Erwinia sp. P6884]|uniref:serine acetyltransferase n=1 Tax=Erwinia sp. P6884 TaxID=3141450 RepID=UPI003189E97D